MINDLYLNLFNFYKLLETSFIHVLICFLKIFRKKFFPVNWEITQLFEPFGLSPSEQSVCFLFYMS